MFSSIPYIPGKPHSSGVLTRFLPPTREGVASIWLERNLAKGSWVLDPFGAAPDFILEAARAGYRVLVTANNPIMHTILEVGAARFLRSEFQSAVANLASSNIGNERLETYIQSLYATKCGQCGAMIQAKAYLWDRDSQVPFAKIYDCPNCKDSGERSTSTEDKEKAAQFSRGSSLHQARALERVAPLNDPDRIHAEEALEVYLPRSIAAIVAIVNKLEGEIRDTTQHKLLSALLLSTFDQANTLWSHPTERQRPKQLISSPQFRENNIWLAFEGAVNQWVSSDPAIPLTKWPEQPPIEGGICIFDGRIKDLVNHLSKTTIGAVFTAFPRPNQAFWTLSALWAGWLWGPKAVEHFKSVLRRRRYDWGWHTSALQSALGNLETSLPNNTPIFGTINELEPGFLSAVILGARMAGFKLEGISAREEDGQAQISWRGLMEKEAQEDETLDFEDMLSNSGKTYLKTRGEPSPYIYVHAAGLIGLSRKPIQESANTPFDLLGRVQSSCQHAFSYRKGFLRFEGSDKSLEVGQWWVLEPDTDAIPLADRIEMALVELLIKKPGINISEVDRFICDSLPGLMTPEKKFLQVCLESYGEVNLDKDGGWFLREEDNPSKRRNEIHEMANLLSSLGKRLGFKVTPEPDMSAIQWLTDDTQYKFYLSASAVLGKFFQPPNTNDAQTLIVLPGSRSNLVAYKLKCNGHLQQSISLGENFIKYRHLRQLAESQTLNRKNLNEQFALDPLTYTEPQMRLL